MLCAGNKWTVCLLLGRLKPLAADRQVPIQIRSAGDDDDDDDGGGGGGGDYYYDTLNERACGNPA